MRYLLFLLVFMATECRAQSSTWEYDTHTDKLTGSQTISAEVDSNEVIDTGRDNAHGALIVFGPSSDSKPSIRIGAQGVIDCFNPYNASGSYNFCDVRIKFDDDAPIEAYCGQFSGNGWDFLVIARDQKKILARLSTSKKVAIGIPIFQRGEQVATFDTASLDLKRLGILTK